MNPPDFKRAVWRKSSRSGDNGGACVEMAVLDTAVGVRDSKDDGGGPVLVCAAGAWTAFIGGVEGRQFEGA